MRFWFGVGLALLALVACSAAQRVPPGLPPPEYEKPALPAELPAASAADAPPPPEAQAPAAPTDAAAGAPGE